MTTRNQDLPLLETILRELDEALVVCDRQGRILLCNPAARRLFRHHQGLALGGSLYEVCNRGPIAHALWTLEQRDLGRPGLGGKESETRLVCATVDNAILLDCRIRPLAIPGAAEPLLLLTFADLTRQLADLGKTSRVVPTLMEELRHPLSNLVTAASNLQGHPEMSPENRSDFIEIVYRESGVLTDRFENLVREYRASDRQPWPLADVNSADLFGCLVQRMTGEEGAVVTMTGEPLWLRADSYSLLLVLETLVRFVRKLRGETVIDLEALLGDRRVYLDLVWPGAPIPPAVLDLVLQSPLPEGGGVTVAEVLWRHDSELWSVIHHRPGFALLRLPLPLSRRQSQEAVAPVVTQGELYDFSPAGSPAPKDALTDRPLAALDYVVIGTETTGRQPAGGDELQALAAVRIGKGRILSSKRFEHLVKPGLPITKVLPEFRAFVGEAALVAHDASFALNFFRGQEEGAMVPFDNPLLDTLLLALLVDEHRPDLTLAGLGEWLGVEVPGRQTAMEGCLLTARIFLRLLDRLAERGLTSLGQVAAASARLLDKQATEGGAGR
ncbi:MAG TPA: PAS domain-containing protein, partial [Desulfurivibrionaceae bacterium]|nr:PAS domain-containing protein [Desulfurivibrionaceae bacterium]